MKHVEMIIDYIVDGDDFQYCDNKGKLIRCKDCKYCNRNITIERNKYGWETVVNECTVFKKYVNDIDYCSWSERRAEQ